MMDGKKVKIGNENFKEWLRSQDPLTRVRRMSNIGRTMYAMGLRGSEIKAALAQLSQRCQVMAVKLTKEDIQNLSRPKHPQNRHQALQVRSTTKQENESKSLTSKKGNLNLSNEDSNSIMRRIAEDDDKGDMAKNELLTEKTAIEKKDKEVNKYSTIVNYNCYHFFETTPCSELTNSKPGLKRKLYIGTPQKKLRIDVSTSDEASQSKKEQVISIVESNTVSKKPSKKNSKRKFSGKKKSKKDQQKKTKCSFQNMKSVNSEEDAMKELWSILGMESPIDRTAKFFSNQHRVDNSSVTITSHQVPEEQMSTELPVDKPHTISFEQVVDSSNESDNIMASNSVSRSENDAPDTVLPFLKISEAFSLANVNDEDCNITSDKTSTLGMTSEKIISDPKQNGRQETDPDKKRSKLDSRNVNGPKPLGGSYEDVDSGIMNKNLEGDQNNSSGEESRKVGTIRVKSLGLLMDPKLQPTNSINMLPSSDALNKDSEETSVVKSKDDLFFDIYSYYFDELVEVKIPKLGEILHLAIADEMRLTERVKRADQLSSEDLIKEEKRRARKEFIDMMKIRGHEFSPLCDNIVNKFQNDVSSKETLFLALFCRILQHAGSIDPANESYISKAKKVIRLMMVKHKYKDLQIPDVLNLDDEDFEEEVNIVREMVARCLKRYCSTATHPTCNDSRNSVVPIAPSSTNIPQEKINNTHNLNTDAHNRLQPMSAKYYGRRKSTVPSQVTTTINSNTEPSRDNRNNAFKSTPIVPNGNQNSCRTNLTQQCAPTLQNKSIVNGLSYPQVGTTQVQDMANAKAVLNYLQATLAKQNVSMKMTASKILNSNASNNNNSIRRQHPVVAQNNNINLVKNHPRFQHRSDNERPRLQTVPGTFITTSPCTGTVRIKPAVEISPSTASTSSGRTRIVNPPSKLLKTVETPISDTVGVCATSATSMTIVDRSSSPMSRPVPNPSPVKLTSHRDSSTLPERGTQQQEACVFDFRDAHLSRLNPVNSSAPVIVRDVVDYAVNSIVGIVPDQLPIEDNITITPTRPAEGISASRNMKSSTKLAATSVESSPETPRRPEVTSSTSEVNLPSSSHCHPFIARRPISGKMKMLFETQPNI